MRGQRYARLNLDFHAMTKAPESQTHVVDRVGCVLRHVRPKRKEPRQDAICQGSCCDGRVGSPTIGQLRMLTVAVKAALASRWPAQVLAAAATAAARPI